MVSYGHPVRVTLEKTMNQKTCAVCDYVLDDNAIQVTIGGETVEVCCEDCAKTLREARASTGSDAGST